MGLFVNCLAVVFSTVIVSCGINYFAREKNAGCLRYYMLIMGNKTVTVNINKSVHMCTEV